MSIGGRKRGIFFLVLIIAIVGLPGMLAETCETACLTEYDDCSATTTCTDCNGDTTETIDYYDEGTGCGTYGCGSCDGTGSCTNSDKSPECYSSLDCPEDRCRDAVCTNAGRCDSFCAVVNEPDGTLESEECGGEATRCMDGSCMSITCGQNVLNTAEYLCDISDEACSAPVANEVPTPDGYICCSAPCTEAVYYDCSTGTRTERDEFGPTDLSSTECGENFTKIYVSAYDDDSSTPQGLDHWYALVNDTDSYGGKSFDLEEAVEDLSLTSADAPCLAEGTYYYHYITSLANNSNASTNSSTNSSTLWVMSYFSTDSLYDYHSGYDLENCDDTGYCEQVSYSVNYDADSNYCTRVDCGLYGSAPGIWDPDGGACCGDDWDDDPDILGETSCLNCSRGLRNRGDQGDTIKRDWTNGVSGNGCCGDDIGDCSSTDAAAGGEANYLCIDFGGTFSLAEGYTRPDSSQAGSGNTGDADEACDVPGLCEDDGGSGDDDSDEVYSTGEGYWDYTNWYWIPADSSSTEGNIFHAKCSNTPFLSDGDQWVGCDIEFEEEEETLESYHEDCNEIEDVLTIFCYSAMHKYCGSGAAYGIGQEFMGNNMDVLCGDAAYENNAVDISELSNCEEDDWKTSGDCIKAVHEYCDNQGYETGIANEWSGNTWGIRCMDDSDAEVIGDLDFSANLDVQNTECEIDNLQSTECYAATHRYCIEASDEYLGGFPIEQQSSTDVKIACIKGNEYHDNVQIGNDETIYGTSERVFSWKVGADRPGGCVKDYFLCTTAGAVYSNWASVDDAIAAYLPQYGECDETQADVATDTSGYTWTLSEERTVTEVSVLVGMDDDYTDVANHIVLKDSSGNEIISSEKFWIADMYVQETDDLQVITEFFGEVDGVKYITFEENSPESRGIIERLYGIGARYLEDEYCQLEDEFWCERSEYENVGDSDTAMTTYFPEYGSCDSKGITAETYTYQGPSVNADDGPNDVNWFQWDLGEEREIHGVTMIGDVDDGPVNLYVILYDSDNNKVVTSPKQRLYQDGKGTCFKDEFCPIDFGFTGESAQYVKVITDSGHFDIPGIGVIYGGGAASTSLSLTQTGNITPRIMFLPGPTISVDGSHEYDIPSEIDPEEFPGPYYLYDVIMPDGTTEDGNVTKKTSSRDKITINATTGNVTISSTNYTLSVEEEEKSYYQGQYFDDGEKTDTMGNPVAAGGHDYLCYLDTNLVSTVAECYGGDTEGQLTTEEYNGVAFDAGISVTTVLNNGFDEEPEEDDEDYIDARHWSEENFTLDETWYRSSPRSLKATFDTYDDDSETFGTGYASAVSSPVTIYYPGQQYTVSGYVYSGLLFGDVSLEMFEIREDEEGDGVACDSSIDCSSNVYNCADFPDHAYAQDVFECCGGTGDDVHNLDSDDDGIACERLIGSSPKTLCSVSPANSVAEWQLISCNATPSKSRVYIKMEVKGYIGYDEEEDDEGAVWFDDINLNTHYCTDTAEWQSDLDGEDYQASCTTFGFGATGEYCCGEGDDGIDEFYNDVLGACIAGEVFWNWSTVDYYGKNVSELHVTDGTVHGCAINSTDEDTMEENERWNGSRTENKPYEGGLNLLSDPGFETSFGTTGSAWEGDTGDGTIGDWTIGDWTIGDWTIGDWTIDIEDDDDIVRSGQFYLSLEDGTSPVDIVSGVSAAEYKSYKFSVYAMGGDEGKENITLGYIDYYTGDGGVVNKVLQDNFTLLNGSGWQKIEYDFTVSSTSNWLKVFIRVNLGEGESVYLDDAELKPGTNDRLLDLDNCPNNDCDGTQLVTDHAYCDVLNDDDSEQENDVYCSYTEVWKHTEGFDKSHLSYIPDDWEIPEHLDNSFQWAECCAPTQCWDGDSCIDSGAESDNANAYSEDEDGVDRCVNGEWKYSVLKQRWDLKEEGYCGSASMCFVSENGVSAVYSPVRLEYVQSPVEYAVDEFASYNTEDDLYYGEDDDGDPELVEDLDASDYSPVTPTCVEDGGYISDHLCQNGTWTTRTAMTVLALLNMTEEGGDEFDYRLFCDSYENSVNEYGYGVPYIQYDRDEIVGSLAVSDFYIGGLFGNIDSDYTADESACTNHIGEKVDCVNNICVLHYYYGDEREERTVVGTSLNLPVNHTYTFLTVLGSKDQFDCTSNDNDQDNNEYDECANSRGDDSKVYYHDGINAIVYSHSDIPDPDGEGGILQAIISFFSGLLSSVLDFFQEENATLETSVGGELPLTSYVGEYYTQDFAKFYSARAGYREIAALLEEQIYDENDDAADYLYVSYYGFSTDLCDAIDALDFEQSSYVSYTCVYNNGIYEIASYRVGSAATHENTLMDTVWRELTSRLRVKSTSTECLDEGGVCCADGAGIGDVLEYECGRGYGCYTACQSREALDVHISRPGDGASYNAEQEISFEFQVTGGVATYDYKVDWESDGVVDEEGTVESDGDSTTLTVSYATDGEYTIMVNVTDLQEQKDFDTVTVNIGITDDGDDGEEVDLGDGCTGQGGLGDTDSGSTDSDGDARFLCYEGNWYNWPACSGDTQCSDWDFSTDATECQKVGDSYADPSGSGWTTDTTVCCDAESSLSATVSDNTESDGRFLCFEGQWYNWPACDEASYPGCTSEWEFSDDATECQSVGSYYADPSDGDGWTTDGTVCAETAVLTFDPTSGSADVAGTTDIDIVVSGADSLFEVLFDISYDNTVVEEITESDIAVDSGLTDFCLTVTPGTSTVRISLDKLREEESGCEGTPTSSSGEDATSDTTLVTITLTGVADGSTTLEFTDAEVREYIESGELPAMGVDSSSTAEIIVGATLTIDDPTSIDEDVSGSWTFDADVANGETYFVDWQGGGITTENTWFDSDPRTFDHYYTEGGTYTITFTVTDTSGVDYTETLDVEVIASGDCPYGGDNSCRGTGTCAYDVDHTGGFTCDEVCQL